MRGERQSNNFPNFLSRFYGNSPENAARAVAKYLKECPGASKGEVFRELTRGKGRESTHGSTFQARHYEGRLKNS